MRQLMPLMEESQVAKQAKAMGLDYLEFGRYGKNGKMTHKVVNGKLVPAKSDDPSGKAPLPKTKSGKIEPQFQVKRGKLVPYEKKPPAEPSHDFDVKRGKLVPTSKVTGQSPKSADDLMSLDYKVWDKLGIQSGGPGLQKSPVWAKYKAALAQIVKTPIKHSVVLKLEDENHHSMLKALGEIGMIDKSSPYYKSLSWVEEDDPEDQAQEELEDKILDAHQKLITSKFGKKAADDANYGWAADDDMYGTKVYTKGGTMILATHIGKGGKLTHQWERG